MSKSPSLTLPQIEKFDPCKDDFARVQDLLAKHKGKRITASMARKAGCTFDDIIWVASVVSLNDKDVERRLRLFKADCAARVLHAYEKQYTDDDRPRKAIIAARQFARGEVDEAAAWAAAWAAWDAAWDAAWAAASDTAWAARDAPWAAASDAASDAEREWQFDRLIARLSAKEPEDWPLPARSQEGGE